MAIVTPNKKNYDIWIDNVRLMKQDVKTIYVSDIINKRENHVAWKDFEDLCDIHGLDVNTTVEEIKTSYYELLRGESIVVVEEEEEVPMEPTETFQDVLSECGHPYEIEVISSIMAQNKQEKNPAWLALIAPPSSGKSTDLRLCSHKKYAKPIDSITDNALAAARPNMDVEQSDDVFSKSDNMTLVFNDMGSMFGDRDDKITKFIGYLTTAFGGNFNRAGPTEIRHYDTKMAVIMGMTDRVYRQNISKMASFGNRFLTLKYIYADDEVFDDDDFDENELGVSIQNHIKTALQRDWSIPFAEDLKEVMKLYIRRIVKIRSFFYAKTQFDLERPHRLFNQLKNLMKSRARLHNKPIVDMDDFNFVKPLIWLSLPYTQLIFNIGKNGVVQTAYARKYKDMLRNGKRLGLLTSAPTGAAVGDINCLKYKFSSVYADIIDEIVNFLEEIGYEQDIDNMSVKTKGF